MINDVLYLGRYVWNLNKAALNIQNHDIRFEDAIKVFSDPFAVDD
jgi:uncharacterized DUF497 family protein